MTTIGILVERKQLLRIVKCSETLKYANIISAKKIQELNNASKICSCPECKSNEDVTCTGTNNGKRKFVCRNPIHGSGRWFSVSTSFEAMEIYREAMTEILCLFAQTNSTIKGITDYNECSKHFVEYALEGLYAFINDTQQFNINISPNADIMTIFLDISGSGLAKNKAIILARIGEKILFEIITTSSYISSHEILSQIKNRLNVSDNTTIVFVTDGEKCFVDSIKHFFPDSIHIRQFHSKSCKGIVYVHLNYCGKEYTIRCVWDAVLNEGEASQKTQKMREYKAAQMLEKKEREGKSEYSELSKEVIVWEGTVYEPRGIRRKIPNKTKRKKGCSTTPKKDTYHLDAPIIFRGEIEDAKKIPVFAYCYEIFKKIFAGRYITSNLVETIFNFKSKFYPHRTIKFGKRLIHCILYCHLILKDKTKQELMSFFKENVITYEFVMTKVLYGSGLQKNKPEKPNFLKTIQNAMQLGRNLSIHYRDANKKHTSRVITPLKINVCEYDNTTQLESFCHLRNAKRTFYLDRMIEVVICDPRPILL